MEHVERYQFELRKQKCIFPVDPNFIKFVVPDYDRNTGYLKVMNCIVFRVYPPPNALNSRSDFPFLLKT